MYSLNSITSPVDIYSLKDHGHLILAGQHLQHQQPNNEYTFHLRNNQVILFILKAHVQYGWTQLSRTIFWSRTLR